MAEPQTPDQPAPAAEKLYTLSEISQRTGISMPTLQRYKKSYQGRLPSVGSGRKQRYPEHALPVFEEIRTENAGRRGRPRKSAAAGAPRATRKPGRPGRRPGRRPAATAAGRRAGAAGRRAGGARAVRRPAGRRPGRPAGAAARRARPAARRGRPPGRAAAGRPGRPRKAAGRPGRPRKAAAGPGRPRRAAGRVGRPAGAGGRRATGGRRRGTEGLLTLTEISKTTGISYPTLVRYVRLYSRRLPHAGEGRARRFYPAAVEVFRSLRQQSGRGGRRPKGAAGNGRRRAAGGARRGRPPARRGRPPGRPGRPPGRRGRPPKSAAAGGGSRLEAMLVERVRDLERFKQAIERQFGDLVKGLKRLR